jgi:hypothetical protein
MAETKGTFSSISDFSPLLNLTRGAFNETFSGVHSFVVKSGINKYSLKVRETSLINCAITLGF